MQGGSAKITGRYRSEQAAAGLVTVYHVCFTGEAIALPAKSTSKGLHMLYKFKSKTTGDVIMLQPNGQRVLEIIGKDTQTGSGDKGIILPEQMPAAIAALEAAIVQEDAERKAAVAQALANHEAPPRFEAISLHQRALPFIDMLRRCQKAGTDIVWGV